MLRHSIRLFTPKVTKFQNVLHQPSKQVATSHHKLAYLKIPRRSFYQTPPLSHGYAAKEVDPETAITVTFILRDGTPQKIQAPPGKSLLEIAHANDIDLEGACEGSLACSTCHIYLDEETFDKVEEPGDDENDMLDLAFGLAENSRLGCQIIANEVTDGMTVTLPPATRNMAVDGHVPRPH